MKLLALLAVSTIALSRLASGQVGIQVLLGTSNQNAGSGVTVTSLMGGTARNPVGTDSGNGLLSFASQFKTGSSWTSISFPSCSFWVDSPDTTKNSGCAVYTDSATAPNTLVCGAHTGTPSSGWNTLALSGCGTISASTNYWIAYTTESSTQGQQFMYEVCPWTSLSTRYAALSSFTNPTYWPSTFPSIAGNDALNCYAAYANVTYTTTDQYQIISMGHLDNASNCTICVTNIAPLGTGHSLILPFWNAAAAVSSVTDSASDSLTQRTAHTVSGQQIALYSIDRATAAASSITVNQASANPTGLYIELAGTASTSFDVAASDSALQATPFTSAATASTAQAQEFGVGFAINTLNNGTFAGTNGWTAIYSLPSPGGGNPDLGVFTQTFNSTGTKTLQGTHSTSGTNNLTGLATFR